MAQLASRSLSASPLKIYLILQSLFSMFLTLASAAPKTPTDALMHPQPAHHPEQQLAHHLAQHPAEEFPEWTPTCIGPLLPEHGVNGIRNYHFSAAQHQDQWADIHHAPALTTLQAFCTNHGRGADCACVDVDDGEIVLNCNGYLGDYPALENCFRRCECVVGVPWGRRRQGGLDVIDMSVGRTVVHVN